MSLTQGFELANRIALSGWRAAMRRFFTELARRDRVLATTGWVCAGLALAMACLTQLDPRSVLGINPWIKPMKFQLSFVTFAWTVGWFLAYAERPRWVRPWVRWGVVAVLLTESVIISGQAARGVQSHFNFDTRFDFHLFNAMGVAIGFNTLLMALLLVSLAHRCPGVDRVYLWGMRLGLLIFFLGCLEASAMLWHGGHAVAVADDSLGLPVLNWSRLGGDLRIAHFLGIHALQVCPIVGWLLARWRAPIGQAGRLAYLFIVAFLYVGLTAWTFHQALAGRPLLPL